MTWSFNSLLIGAVEVGRIDAEETLSIKFFKYDVLIAVNGIEAINLIQGAVPEEIVALILDLNMPKADGFAVLDYLKENELSKRIPVCIITGDVEKEKIDRAFTYKVVDVIPKPFTSENVRNVIEKIKF